MQVRNSRFLTCKPPYSHPLQLPSMSTPSFIYFPLILQALLLNLFRVVSRLSQCVARTFYAVSNPHLIGLRSPLTQPSPPTARKAALHSGMLPQPTRCEPSSNDL